MIWPRKSRDGFNLQGETLPFGLWYRDEDAAISYAQHRAGGQRGVIEIRDEHDQVVRQIEVEGRDGPSILGRI